MFYLFQDTYTMANEDDKVEYLFCFVAFIVGSVMNPDVCLYLQVQLIILYLRSKSASRVLSEMGGWLLPEGILNNPIAFMAHSSSLW